MVEAPPMYSSHMLPTGFTPEALADALAALPAQITDATANSREAKRGAAFLAYRGAARDGRDFIADAVTRGVSAVLYDPEGFAWNNDWKVPCLAVPNLKRHASQVAGNIYGHPSDALWMTGVTGTNGKTSVAQWVALGLERAGKKSAVLGTIGNGMVGHLAPADTTTPDAVALQRQLRDYLKQGAVACAMEVSSHGLDQGRVADIKYDVAVYTNLTRDHLDYHGTMAEYGEAKAKLFEQRGLKHAIINADDPFGQQLVARLGARQGNGLNLIRTSTRQAGPGGHSADLFAEQLSVSAAGLAFEIAGKFGRANVESDILGAFNVSNLLLVIGTLLVSGVSLEDAAAIACELPPVPGRMQTVRSSDRNKPLVVVDYAHTPDALEKALSTLAAVVPENGRLISVFGCGGDRDRGKRPQMGTISARYADLSIVTSDNPRTENAQRIIEDIESGMKGAKFRSIPDRHQAIFEALNDAKAGDIVMIAGKGHEDYQVIGDVKHHFSDVEVAQEALATWHGAGK
ncbi:MAG: UDP-N-acetylmuramoyl-L-alanyl-D-glutamate--2,6-diaminopimelate ligase [Usitatibacteraceae bacterium]